MAEPLCPHCSIPMTCVWADSTHGCGWYLTCTPCAYFDEDSFDSPEEELEEDDNHIHRVMQVVLNPEPGEPTAWLDGEPLYAKQERDRTP